MGAYVHICSWHFEIDEVAHVRCVGWVCRLGALVGAWLAPWLANKVERVELWIKRSPWGQRTGEVS